MAARNQPKHKRRWGRYDIKLSISITPEMRNRIEELAIDDYLRLYKGRDEAGA